MKTQLSPLELLEKFFNDNSEEAVKAILNEFDEKSFDGPTVEDYFNNFHKEFETFHNINFTCEYSKVNKLNDIKDYLKEIHMKDLFTYTNSVTVKSSKSEFKSETEIPLTYSQAA